MRERFPHGHERLFAFGPPPWRPQVWPHRERGRRRGGRGRGANVRLAILTLLAERPMHGYEMIQEIEQRSGGSWRPSPGSVYPTLQLLEDEGLIVAEAVEGGRKRYTLTDAGRESQSGEAATERAPWEDLNEEYGQTIIDSKMAVQGIMQAMGEVMRAGSDSQRRRAHEVLDRARRELYQILADEDGQR
jgi:DNA-binding PadR family transcriptional regulator